jgi:hypothetical protein
LQRTVIAVASIAALGALHCSFDASAAGLGGAGHLSSGSQSGGNWQGGVWHGGGALRAVAFGTDVRVGGEPEYGAPRVGAGASIITPSTTTTLIFIRSAIEGLELKRRTE